MARLKTAVPRNIAANARRKSCPVMSRLSITRVVSEPLFFRPRRVTLRFEKRGNLGREITFVPAGDFTLSPFRAVRQVWI